jgi:FkbM family methyltransferase
LLPAQTLLGKLLRVPLSLLPKEREIPILRGPLRGKRWIVGASSHGCWAGTYEVDQLADFATAIKPGFCVYDVGANVGIYTLLASVKAGASGSVYAFEPVERNLRYLRRHVVANQVQNCTIVKTAVSNTDGIQRFSVATWERSMERLAADGEVEVSSLALDTGVYQKGDLRPPKVIKIDVEGAELLVLQGAIRLITEYHPSVFVEVHGGKQHAECRDFLVARNYRVREAYGRLVAT